jgi:predicted outer membrane repeat protein
LRNAIDTANSTAGPDTIVFSGAATSGNLNLTLGQLPTITEALTITGPGATAVSITGMGTTRIFDLDIGGGGTFDATISGLTLTHDSGTVTGDGGAVLNEGTHLTLADDVIHGNKSDSGGGGVATDTDTNMLVLQNTEVSGNTAGSKGGGVYVTGNRAELDVTDSTISGNTATNSEGGALYFYSGRGVLNVTNSTMSDNTAGSYGGAAWVGGEYGHATFSGATVSGNTAGGGGGGLSLYIDNVAISNTTISGNTADGSGGGLYSDDISGGFSIDNSTINDNTASSDGGGVWFDSPYAPVTITNTTISGNTAVAGGGAYIEGESEGGSSVTFSNSTLSGNTATDGSGGGLYAGFVGSPVSLFNSTVSGNTAAGEGGGVSFAGYYGLNLVQTTITNNTATTFGGLYLPVNEEVVKARHAAHVQADAGNNHPEHKAAHESAQGAHAQSVTKLPVNGETNSTGTIIAGNTGTDIGAGSVVDSNHSLFGSVDAGTTVNDLGGTLTGVDPMLGPLGDNGGPTQTHALLAGSPAINTSTDPVADFTGNAYDQRGAGFLRADVVSGLVDIGAFEVQTEAPTPAPTPAPAVLITPKFTG